MFTAIIIIFIIAFILALRWRLKASTNSKPVINDKYFKQADIEIDFSSGKLNIGKQSFSVNQVTGVKSQPFKRQGFRETSMWNAIIELDDLAMPQHTIRLKSRTAADNFTQRFCIALRKAGGPSFV